MPQRFLRAGITTSVRFNALDWQAQSLFMRLLTLVDDHGRFEAHPTLLKSMAFPFNPDITCEQMLALCEQMLAQKMVAFYEVEGTRYLQVSRWKERARSESKFPPPPANICEHLTTFDSKCSPPSPSPSPSPSPASAPLAHARGESRQGLAAPAPPASAWPKPTIEEWLQGVIPDDGVRQWSADYWERKFHSAGQRQWHDWRNQEIRDWRAYRSSLQVTFRNEHAEKLTVFLENQPPCPEVIEAHRAELEAQGKREGMEALEILRSAVRE